MHVFLWKLFQEFIKEDYLATHLELNILYSIYVNDYISELSWCLVQFFKICTMMFTHIESDNIYTAINIT